MANQYMPLPERDWQRRLSLVLHFIIKRRIEGECWIWTGQRDKHGYGRTAAGNKKKRFTHNLAYRMLKGPLLDSQEPDHLCKNRACFNPEHLEAVSQPENSRRGNAAKLNHTQIAIIRALDEPHTITAKFFNVHPSTICDIRNHRRWNYEGKSS